MVVVEEEEEGGRGDGGHEEGSPEQEQKGAAAPPSRHEGPKWAGRRAFAAVVAVGMRRALGSSASVRLRDDSVRTVASVQTITA